MILEHDLDRRNPTAADLRQKTLRYDSEQNTRQLRPNLVLLIRRKDIDDTVYRLGTVVRMQRRENEVSGLGGRHGGTDGFKIAQLTQKHDIRVLTEHCPKRLRETLRIPADLPLIDDAPILTVDEFDRILDGQDVLIVIMVDKIDDGRQSGRFPVSHRPGHQDKPLGILGIVVQGGRNIELLEAP